MVIGGLRNEITEILARPMPEWNLLQVSVTALLRSVGWSIDWLVD